MTFRRILYTTGTAAAAAALLLSAFLFMGGFEPNPDISWGVSFSPVYAEDLGLDWKEAYRSMLSDLGADRVRFALHWSFFEPEQGSYRTDELKWIIRQAGDAGASLLLAVGMKTPRWPECHIPSWAEGLTREQQQERILLMLRKIVGTAEHEDAVGSWQVENEPFFGFGNCPWRDDTFTKTEVDLVRSLDSSSRPVIVTESGEQSWWFKAARIADIVGVTTYRQTWIHEIGIFFRSPLPPEFYGRKARLIERIFGKPVIGVELQAEPWGPEPLFILPPERHLEIFDLAKFRDNISYARASGIDTFYLWGAEWWYWRKEVRNDPSFWEEAKLLWES